MFKLYYNDNNAYYKLIDSSILFALFGILHMSKDTIGILEDNVQVFSFFIIYV